VTQGRYITTDVGSSLDFLLDPSVVIDKEVQRAVRRWRLMRLNDLLPGLVPIEPDIIIHGAAGSLEPSRDIIVDYADVLGALLSHKGASCKVFDLWTSNHKSSLRSAASGGQWNQARIAAVREWEQDSACQLCKDSVGTLEHRLECKCIVPADGWQPPPAGTAHLLSDLSPPRRKLLATRGIFVAKVRMPSAVQQESLHWVMRLPPDAPDDLVWFIDGSMFDEKRRFARSRGFALVATSAEGRVLAIASGTPPHYVHDSAGAELWALHVLLGCTPSLRGYTPTARASLMD
jgi:hypothetical protein